MVVLVTGMFMSVLDVSIVNVAIPTMQRDFGSTTEEIQWVAIVAADTVITGIYGMNFDYMPELHTRFSYFICLAVMLVLNATLYRRFRRSGWL